MEEIDEEMMEWEDNPSNLPFGYHMIAGSIAGLAEHLCMFPVDTLKTNIQCERCGSVSPLGTWECAAKIVGREGILRLWRGVTATFAGCVPAHAAYFSVFEATKVFSGASEAGHHPVAAAVTGAAASLSHDICMTPFDTVKQRMQLGYYQSVRHCITTMMQQEGLRAFYISLPTTVLMNLPYGMIMVTVNETAKKFVKPNHNSNNNNNGSSNHTVGDYLLCGSIAGAVASLLTTPLDVIKTKLQTHELKPCPRARQVTSNLFSTNSGSSGSGSSSSKKYIPQFGQTATLTTSTTTSENSSSSNINSSNNNSTCRNSSSSSKSGHPLFNMFSNASSSSSSSSSTGASTRSAWQITKTIFKEQGYKGFLVGSLPRMLIHTPSVAISWTTYEYVKKLLIENNH